MLLTKDGVSVDVSHPSDVKRYKQLGYKEEKIEEPAQPEKTGPTIAEIYAMCEKAGVDPEDLVIEGENPTMAQVKAAIKAAQKAAKEAAKEAKEPAGEKDGEA